MPDIAQMTALELGKRIQEREVSAEEAVRACLTQIQREETQIHAFVTIEEETALARARKVQKQIDRDRKSVV